MLKSRFSFLETLIPSRVRGFFSCSISDLLPSVDSSAGVQFFSTPVVPLGFQVVSVLGFVSSIQSEDDPEYVCIHPSINTC